mgnify:CR=1 FL=1|jgi:hypothetical protein
MGPVACNDVTSDARAGTAADPIVSLSMAVCGSVDPVTSAPRAPPAPVSHACDNRSCTPRPRPGAQPRRASADGPRARGFGPGTRYVVRRGGRASWRAQCDWEAAISPRPDSITVGAAGRPTWRRRRGRSPRANTSAVRLPGLYRRRGWPTVACARAAIPRRLVAARLRASTAPATAFRPSAGSLLCPLRPLVRRTQDPHTDRELARL